ncbi:MAG: hypothetical protein HQK54_17985, partial [Oligoflexales bacterium]|nr:hypothetical protein [Oligoflexales bacterium]
ASENLIREGAIHSAVAIGIIDDEGNLFENGDYSMKMVYREFRYSIRDRITAATMGVIVKNQEDFTIYVNPRE